MAGWKLRKDKAQAEAPETTEDPETTKDPETTDDPSMPRWDDPATGTEDTFLPATLEPVFEADGLDTEFDDAEPLHTGSIIALGGESETVPVAPLPDFEMGEEVNFEDDDEDDFNSEEHHAALIFQDPIDPPKMPTDTSKEAEAAPVPAAAASMSPPPAETAPETEAAPEEAIPEEAIPEEAIPEEAIPEVAPFVMNTPAAPPAADLPHRLVMRVGRLSAAFEITKEVTVIGRPDSNLHYYPDIEVEMDDAVSRRHAEVLKAGDGQYYLIDSGSTNGTRLNGETLPPNEERPLAHGDRIHVGERTEIIFE